MIAMTGTAFAATGQLVNIADGTNAARIAKVGSTGSLQVGDAIGPLTVDGTTTSRESVPSALFTTYGGARDGDGCGTIASAPSGKALVIKTLSLDTYLRPTPSDGTFLRLYVGPCEPGYVVMDFDKLEAGQRSVSLDPGLAIPAGAALRADVQGSTDLAVQIAAFGYKVPGSAVAPLSASRSSGPAR
ncbi:MAG TPA: hypothetical protein VF533_22775 [Solirubrobacteraceae bacterium]